MNQEDKQFMSQFMIVLGALVVFTVIIFFLARYLMATNAVNHEPLIGQQVEERIEPIGEVNTGKVKSAAAGGTSAGGAQSEGQEIYANACAACHDSGTAGAPMLTDAGVWQPRIKQGKQTLYDHAINGFNAMPPKGGAANLSDAQVQAAVDYIVSTASGGTEAKGGGQAEAPATGKQQPARAAAPARGGADRRAPGAQPPAADKNAPRQRNTAQGEPAGG